MHDFFHYLGIAVSIGPELTVPTRNRPSQNRLVEKPIPSPDLIMVGLCQVDSVGFSLVHFGRYCLFLLGFWPVPTRKPKTLKTQPSTDPSMLGSVLGRWGFVGIQSGLGIRSRLLTPICSWSCKSLFLIFCSSLWHEPGTIKFGLCCEALFLSFNIQKKLRKVYL